MIWSMSPSTFTLVHILVSLVGIGSGLVVMYGLLTRKRLNGWTALFLASTVATSVTGFGFPFDRLLPPIRSASSRSRYWRSRSSHAKPCTWQVPGVGFTWSPP